LNVIRSSVTVVIPVSPSPTHPPADLLIATVDSIRHHMGDVRIFITFDGVREQQEHLRTAYEKHIRIVDNLCLHDAAFRGVDTFEFRTHQHQVGMMREIIDEIPTPYLIYVEHDMMLRIGREIDFERIIRFMDAGYSDAVRLYLKSEIPAAHDYLMHGLDDHDPAFLATSQWSQNVHIATVEMYKDMLNRYFTKDANCYIEDAVWGRIADEYPRYRLHIYHPEQEPKYLLHLDGRRHESKHEDLQRF
jgi:hypothetical protein